MVDEAVAAAGQVVVPIAAGPTLAAGGRYGLVLSMDNGTLEFVASSLIRSGLSIMYDGTPSSGRIPTSFPIPATLGSWTESDTPPAMTLRA